MPSIYELQAPLLAMKAARIDSPVSNDRTYADDARFFREHPGRRSNIREEMSGEFDLKVPISEWLQMPRLWNLVIQIAKGVHTVIPIYRGRRFWNGTLVDDEAVSTVLIEMARQEGINVDEFISFGARVKAQNSTPLNLKNVN